MSSKPDVVIAAAHTINKQRRRNLRVYQRELIERTHEARAAHGQQRSRLAIQAGNEKFLIDLTQVSEVMSLSGMTAVPLTKAWFMGLTQCRGNLVGVVDLAGFLGKAVDVPVKSDRLLIFAGDLALHCAIRVTRVLGLIDISAMTCQPLQASAPDWASRHYIDDDGCGWTELDLASLAQAPAFLDVSYKTI